jgi:phospholipase/carboxylesterase
MGVLSSLRLGRAILTISIALGAASCSRGTSRATPPAPPFNATSRFSHVLRFSTETRPAHYLVVFLHGYGGRADDASGLARKWAAGLTHADVLVPDGIEPFEGGGEGRQWFGLARLDDQHREVLVRPAGEAISSWIDAELDARGLGRDRVIVTGFSQGGMLSQWLAVRRRPAPLAAVSFSGQFLVDDPVSATRTSTPVLLVHGTNDARIPVARAEEARASLAARGAPVELLLVPGMTHTIDQQSSDRALSFMRAHAPRE